MKDKVCHFYWGGGALSYLQHLSVVSFKKHNPDWEVNLWMPKVSKLVAPTWESEEHVDRYTGKDFLEATKKLCNVKLVDFQEWEADTLHEVQKSDFIRWKVLYDYGGVWSDLDILYIKPLHKLLEQDFDATICYDGFHHFIGFFVAKPKQPIYKDIFEEARERVKAPFSNDYQFLGSRMLKSMYFGIMTINKVYPDSKILNLPVSLLYSYTADDVSEMLFGKVDRTNENIIGLHWYNGHPLAKKYLNSFDKYRQNDSVISRRIAEFSA